MCGVQVMGMNGMVRVDGNPYCWMGVCSSAAPNLAQTSQTVLPLETVYTFTGAGIQLTATFSTPGVIGDIELLSLPISYITGKFIREGSV